MSKSKVVFEKDELSETSTTWLVSVYIQALHGRLGQNSHVETHALVVVVCRRPRLFLREALPGSMPVPEPLLELVVEVSHTDAEELKNHVSLLPVSRITCCDCAGVPTVTEAKYPP